MTSNQVPDNNKSKSRKEWSLLFLSLLLAFIVWLMHVLSLQYSVLLEYKMDLSSSLEGRARSSVSEDVLIVRGKADGYYILQHRVGRNDAINVTADAAQIHKAEGDNDRFYVNCEQIKGNIIDAIGSSVELEFVVTDSMSFEFPKLTSKFVPVVVRSEVTYDGQYMPMAPLSIEPDSIEIFGEERIIENIDSVWTEAITFNRLDKSVHGLVDLVPFRRIEFSQSSVYYTLNVSRYIEETVQVPVTVVNVPQDKALVILPANIKVTCRRTFGGEPLSEKNTVVQVDYNNFIKGHSTQIIPDLVKAPDNAVYYQLSPRYVDCLLIDKAN